MTHDETAAEEQLGPEPEGLRGEHHEADRPPTPGARAPGAAPAATPSSTPNGAPAGASSGRPPATGSEQQQGSEPAGEDGDVAEIEGDLDELVKTSAQRDEYLALAQRTQADFENYRKRVAREAAAAQDRGAASLAKELLPALDNLDRALEDARKGQAEDAPEDPLLHGVRLVRSELAGALARAGIESYSPAGEQFDPELHEAVATAAADGCASGTVVEVYQAGYRHRSGIIRPARVVVAA